ncbi:MAG: AAA family ATPase [Actinomycetota bacterium]|jgi:pilus assembly protein CpaE|nr:AAA family ATPase [Actinomycetota bacterium]
MRPILLAGTTDAFARRLYGAVDEALRDRVRLWSAPPTESGGLESMLQANPALVVIGPGLVDSVAIKIAERIDAERPEVGVIIVLQALQGGGTTVEGAMAAGVRGVLSKDSDGDTIRSTVARAVQAADRHLPGAEQTAAVSRARVTTILSPKGGAGKTVLSTNLAVGLASRSPRGVVIVDLDLQFGDVGYALGLKPRHTIYDAVASSGELDITTLKMFLTHHKSDLYALCAPDEPARGEVVTVDAVERIIGLLAADFDHVVIDTVAGLSEHSLATIDHSTDIVFLADMDIPSVRHLAKVVAAFDALEMTRQRRHFVLNRADARVGLSMIDVAISAGLDIELQIPTSKQVPVTLNEGNPIILSNPKSPVSRAIWELVEKIGGKSGREQPMTLKRSA